MADSSMRSIPLPPGRVGCRRCGTCCRQGGPALHTQDLQLIRTGRIPLNSLITIRRGEPVDNPLTGRIQPAGVELVKICGTGRQWTCRYFQEGAGCTVYAHRPQACRALKCWDTGELLKLVETDTLTRLLIVGPDDPMRSVIEEHERLCPCGDLYDLCTHPDELDEARRQELAERVTRDLRFRARVIALYRLQLGQELFYFGRPLFQVLQPLGVRVRETSLGIRLIWPK